MSLTPDPFIGEPILHFGAHLWPRDYQVAGEYGWMWHIRNWNELAGMVNGQCVVGVVTGNGLVPIDKVRSLLSDKFVVVDMGPNTSEGENVTFRMLQDRIPDGPDDVLIYAHGKGVSPARVENEAVRIWTELLYETITFNHSAIVSRMAEGYKLFGAFRVNTPLVKVIKYGWYYSGAFFAVRCKYLRGRPVKPSWGGVERWVGNHFKKQEGWVEFIQDITPLDEYDIAKICPNVVMAGFKWEVGRIGGTHCEQHKREIGWLLTQLRPTDRVLVIGSRGGGVESLMKTTHPGLTTVAIDIKPLRTNPHTVIVGNSRDGKVREAARQQGPFDVVFIDGDHSYRGVKHDWLLAVSLSPRMVVFHDVANTRLHRNLGCRVDKLWEEIKPRFRTTEKIVGCGWGGIGVVHFPENDRFPTQENKE